jgi:hypothetical protein
MGVSPATAHRWLSQKTPLNLPSTLAKILDKSGCGSAPPHS